MVLSHIRLRAFRNCADLSFEPTPGLNILYGPNAQGKTNILEGVAILTSLASFRPVNLRDLIQIGCEEASLSTDVEVGGVAKHVEVRLRERKRQVTLDGAAVPSIRAFREHVCSVVFTSADLSLLTGSPSLRRRFLDRAIENITPEYAEIQKDYARALAQKNAILTGASSGASMLSLWNARLAAAGARMVAARIRFVIYIRDYVCQSFQSISDMEVVPEVTYSTLLPVVEPRIAPIEEALLVALEERRTEEMRRGVTLVGPHRDDLEVTLDAQPAVKFASQGQLRMLAMALKLAELWSLTEQVGVVPVFLLDDVSSELDDRRNRCLMDTLRSTGCQIFVTTTAPDNVPSDGWEKPGLFRVSAGALPDE